MTEPLQPNRVIMDQEYYENNGQCGDRIGLVFFSRLIKKYCKQGRILDYGCGTGHFLHKFSGSKYSKLGYDISCYAVDRARKINPEAEFISNAEAQIADNSLDCICSLHVLEHVQNPADTLDLFSRKLKKDAFLMFVVPNSRSIGRKIKKDAWFAFRDKSHISLLRADEWISIAARNFRIVKVGVDGLWDVPYFKRCPNLIQKLLFYPTAALQLWSNSLFLPIGLGEDLIIIGRKF